MNERFAIAPLGILAILILIGVLLAIFALLRNPNGRKNLLTILIFGAMVGGAMFVGIFAMRASQIPGPGRNAFHAPMAISMLLKPILLFVGIFLIVGVFRAVKNKKAIPIVLIPIIFLTPALLFFLLIPGAHVQQNSAIVYNGPQTPAAPPRVQESTVPLPPAYASPSIWQDSVAGQFTANVYPSKAAALKGMRPKIDELLRKAAEGKPTPPKAVLFAGGLSATEVHSLMDSPETEVATWIVEPLPRNLQENEISIAVNFVLTGERNESHGNRMVLKMQSGVLEITINPIDQFSRAVLKAMVDEKPWLTDLAGYQSTFPNSRFVVARSHSSATDEQTARGEAINDACQQVIQVLWDMNPNRGKLISGSLTFTTTDLESHGLILDRFSQQLYGMAGPICRDALLIDLSPAKIQPLANAKFAMIAEQQKTWARILLSFVGMAAVILVVYAFLNAATRGYYAWSLRIAALVLLGVGVAIVLSLA